jgi:P27 family predicted phage terminase small subunit
MPGRRPKPPHLKLLTGNPGKRPFHKGQPTPKLELSKPPAHLDAEAKREWRRVAPQLYECGLLTVLDVDALAIYCASWSMWVEAEKQLEEQGLTVPGRSGTMKANPWLAVANQARRQMLAMAQEFGMTPLSRGRIKVEPPQSPDPFEDLLGS